MACFVHSPVPEWACDVRKRKLVYLALLCGALVVAWMCYPGSRGIAQGEAEYVGSQICATCHPDMTKEWALTVHRPTLFNKDASLKGCESCHGPGGPHVEEGDPEKIIQFDKLKPDQITAICMKCHSGQHVTEWKSSMHARAKLSCLNCHAAHNPESGTLLKHIENGKQDLEGLTREIEQLQLEVNTAAVGSKEKSSAEERLRGLREKEDTLRARVKGAETAYKRTAEPYVCYNCHKTQQVQSNMASHHPIPENKMRCSDCHNPHGGPYGMLTEDSVNETCFRCHAEKLGPFTFEHPPVAEDCTICHNPHGAPNDNMLTQREPFVCQKCHAGPHSRSNTLGSPATIPQYYNECTDCHTQIHGSDEHAPLHY